MLCSGVRMLSENAMAMFSVNVPTAEDDFAGGVRLARLAHSGVAGADDVC